MIRRALAVLGIALAVTALAVVTASPAEYVGKHRSVGVSAPAFTSSFDAGVWRMRTRATP